ncbi:hypothetical protein OO013_08005 [Mangrovivirga sp. M17]|uniref:Lipoprotein n=1 Tax=Mangrovivirga halotolerans TaxID=2993936 RepID=A0ABT3RPT2_9BACT|nr:hypothetical protein [Mangrovivirga halotolerans]MCX2743804.1 hypothetical protein [Mangrovivirga halotolerans]
MKTIIFIFSLLTLFGCVTKGQKISNSIDCSNLNRNLIAETLMEQFGENWVTDFNEINGEIIIGLRKSSGNIFVDNNFLKLKGISQEEFNKFWEKLNKDHICISNDNPELKEADFLKLWENGKLLYIVYYSNSNAKN